MITEAEVYHFLRTDGAKAVHRQWRDSMLAQGREVAPERMEWETLSEQDKHLDFEIAVEVVMVWAKYVETTLYAKPKYHITTTENGFLVEQAE